MKSYFVIIFFFVLLVGIHFFNMMLNSERIEKDIYSRAVASIKENDLAGNLDISVDGRDVTVRGIVESGDEKQRTYDSLSGVKGVRSVKNRVQVKVDPVVVEKIVERKVPVFVPSPPKEKEVDEETVEYKFKNFQIFFDTNKVMPDGEGRTTVEKVSKYLTDNLVEYVEIHGHADSKGENNYNYLLSKKRANLIYYLLTQKGFQVSKYRVFGHGEEVKLYVGEEEQKRNRRVDIFIKAQK